MEGKVLGAQRLLGLKCLQTDETPVVCHSPSSLQTLRKGEMEVTDRLQENHLQALQLSSRGAVEHFDSRVRQESSLSPPVGGEPLPPAFEGSPVAFKCLKWI